MNTTGENTSGRKWLFSVWAPEKQEMKLHIVHPFDREFSMKKDACGSFTFNAENTGHGTKYYYEPEGIFKDVPDPGSHFQPDGVHGPSEIVDHSVFDWSDRNWKGIDLKEAVIYEIHTGTFTPEGTFEAIIQRLDDIAASGINAIELMPVCQFAGERNWGYDGVFPYSVQNSYGGPEGLKKLVNACHIRNIAVFLDVVYNHLGPEGNYFGNYGPYFTKRYNIPWGDAINFDDAWSDGVREYFSDNPAHWFINYHIDGLRIDAIHEIYDSGAVHIWELTMNKVKKAELKSGRKFHMIAEADFNSPRVIRPPETGGYGFDAIWLDDFHHALYIFLHPGDKNRYEDFNSIEQLAKAFKEGFVHSGETVKFRNKKHGSSSAGIPGHKFIVFNQNHDQIGNRVEGERLSQLVSFEELKLAASAIILSPYIPLLFMGEEYGDDNPFFYFVSHSDKNLIKSVREGRKKEFEGYKWDKEPPDPQDPVTFNRSKIAWDGRFSGRKKILLEWHKELITLRKSRPALKNTSKDSIQVNVNEDCGLTIYRTDEEAQDHLVMFLNFSERALQFYIPKKAGRWIKLLDSKDAKWNEKMDGSTTHDPSPLLLTPGEYFTASGWSVSVYSGMQEVNN